jgi:urocanate hydratase
MVGSQKEICWMELDLQGRLPSRVMSMVEFGEVKGPLRLTRSGQEADGPPLANSPTQS